MLRVAVLNAYTLPLMPGLATLRVQAFLAALDRGGFRLGRDLELEIVDAGSAAEAAAAARRFADDGVDLIHAYGTPNAVTVARATRTIPLVYYGAHPEGIGVDELAGDNVTGDEIRIPLTSSYKSFRFLARFLPQLRVVWVAFYEGSAFVPPRIRELHRQAAERSGRRGWLAGPDGVGFRTLGGLAYILGAEYRELVYTSTAELERALAEIDPREAVLMLYNEPYYPRGTLGLFLRVCEREGIPLVWNNNAVIAAYGGLAGISADFVALGREAGRRAAAILAGTPPRQVPRGVHRDRYAWLNLDTAEHLGLRMDTDVLTFFDRHFRGHPGAICM